jgi:hypothetical protein
MTIIVTEKMFNEMIQCFTKKEKVAHKAAIEGLRAKISIPKISPKETLQTSKIQINLVWENGNTLQTGDYGVAAAYVSLGAATLNVYLSQKKELHLPDIHGNMVHITKETLTKAINATKNWIRVYTNPAAEWNGSYPLEDFAKLFHMSAQALKRKLTAGQGTHRKYYAEHGDTTITRFDPETSMEFILSIKGNGKIGRYK